MKKIFIFILVFLGLLFSVNSALNDSLVDYWKFDGGSLQSEIGKISSTNFGTTSTTGILGEGRLFTSASSQYLQLTNVNSSYDVTTFSYSYWVYFNTVSGNVPGIWKGKDIATRWYHWLYSGGFSTFETIGTTPSSLNKYGAFTTGNWYHIVLVVNSTSNMKYFYVNGVLSNSTSFTGSITPGTEALFIGKYSTNYLNGKVDEVGFWNRPLTSTEISELYNSGIGLTYPFSIASLTFSNISLTNNTYFNTSSIQINTTVLNSSTNGNVNQTYYLYYNNGTFINSTQYTTNNLNGTLNLTGLLDNTYKIYFYAKNNETNVTSLNYTFTIDVTLPVINNSIPNNISNYQFNGSWFSCSDNNLVSCNISINSQNKANGTNFNLTLNGNLSYTITAKDSVNNTQTSTGYLYVNPNQYFRVINNQTGSYLQNYTFGNYNSSGEYIIIPLYDLGIGTHTLQFNKTGYLPTNYTFTFNTSSALNTSFNVTPNMLYLKFSSSTTGIIVTEECVLTNDCSTFNNTQVFIQQYNLSHGYVKVQFNPASGAYQQVFSYYNDNDTYISEGLKIETPNLQQQLKITGSGSPLTSARVCSKSVGTNPMTSLTDWVTTYCEYTDAQGYVDLNIIGGNSYKFCVQKDGYTPECVIQYVPTNNADTYIIDLVPTSLNAGYNFIASTCPSLVTNDSSCQLNIITYRPYSEICVYYTTQTGNGSSCDSDSISKTYYYTVTNSSTPITFNITLDGETAKMIYHKFQNYSPVIEISWDTPAPRDGLSFKDRITSNWELMVVTYIIFIFVAVVIGFMAEKYFNGYGIYGAGVWFAVVAIEFPIFWIPAIIIGTYFIVERVMPLFT